MTTGKGVAVHTIDCKALEKYADEPERWLDIAWGEEAENEMHTGRLKIMLANEPGTLAELSNLIARNSGNIANLNLSTARSATLKFLSTWKLRISNI